MQPQGNMFFRTPNTYRMKKKNKQIYTSLAEVHFLAVLWFTLKKSNLALKFPK